MNGLRLQHGFTIGRHWWLCLAVALGLALGTQVAAAKEYHTSTRSWRWSLRTMSP